MDRFRKSFSDYSSIPVILAVIIILIIMKDTGTTAAISHLAVVFALSFFMRPFLPAHSVSFPNGGFALSYGLGLFLCFYTSWTLSALGLCEYSDPVIHICFAILAAAAYLIRRFVQKREYIRPDELPGMLRGFALFAVIFLFFFWAIGFNPLVDPGTENFMDFGFVQTIYRQKSALPYDPWFSGTKLDHYYYLGQAMVVCMCRLAHTTPEYCYNMMLATFAGMVFSMIYELCGGIAGALLPEGTKKDACAKAGGIIGGALAAFGANPHWLIYGILVPFISKVFGSGDAPSYWFPDGTGYISMDAGDPDNGKSEFPAYSTILGDLHAHVINVMFVLPLLALLFSLVMSYRDDEEKKIKGSRIYSLILISALLGYYKGANYWDFAIYFVITGAVITFSDIKRRTFTWPAIGGIVTKAVMVTALSTVLILPFSMNFTKMESGIGICRTHTPAMKLFVLWGIPAALAVALIFLLIRCRDLDRTCSASLLALAMCTIGLVIVPEVVYVIDIYGEDNARFNTMFKLTYQAVVLFGILTGILFALLLFRMFSGKGSLWTKPALVSIAVYTVLSVSYTVYAANQWLGPFGEKDRLGISALAGLENDPSYGFEMQAYKVLMEDERKVINIVEATGNNYTHECALSVYSGACTPLGWYVHEWMWHNDVEPVRKRADQVRYLYSSSDRDYCIDFLRYYDIDYIFVGPAEVCKYPVYSDIFKEFGQIMTSTIWQERELFLLKVDKSKLQELP